MLTRARRVPCGTFRRFLHRGFAACHPRVAGGPRLGGHTATTNPWGRRTRYAIGRARNPPGHRDTGDITSGHVCTVAPAQLVSYAASMGETPPPCFTSTYRTPSSVSAVPVSLVVLSLGSFQIMNNQNFENKMPEDPSVEPYRALHHRRAHNPKEKNTTTALLQAPGVD